MGLDQAALIHTPLPLLLQCAKAEAKSSSDDSVEYSEEKLGLNKQMANLCSGGPKYDKVIPGGFRL